MIRVLHGLIAVAALKRVLPNEVRIDDDDVLHGLIAVAALKQSFQIFVGAWGVGVLHGLIAVAALKLHVHARRLRRLLRSPRPHRRGRIEA